MSPSLRFLLNYIFFEGGWGLGEVGEVRLVSITFLFVNMKALSTRARPAGRTSP